MSGEPVDESECIPVEIRNTYSAAHSVEAFLVARGMTPRRLGAVRPGSNSTFLFRPTQGLIEYAFHVKFLGWVGESGRANLTSPGFSATPEEVVIWDIGTNMVRMISRDEDATYGRCR